MRQLDILDDGFVRIPGGFERIGGSEDGGSRVQPANNPRLGDGERARLHHLVQHRAGTIGHFVKLVDAANAIVGEDERARLQHQLACVDVFGDVGGETDGRRTLARSVLPARHQAIHSRQQLRLRSSRIAAKQDVNFRPRRRENQ